MIDPVTYLISSHVAYRDALARLLTSMRQIENRRKWVFIGGADRERVVNVAGLPCFEVPHNSYDYTALIEWAARPDGHRNVFLLHDTMELTAESDELIQQANPEMEATAAYPGGRTNLVCYRTDYLLTHYDYIQGLKNCTKEQAISHEGRLWYMTERRTVYSHADCVCGKIDRPFNGAERLHEYYPAVQITKLKANFGRPGVENRL